MKLPQNKTTNTKLRPKIRLIIILICLIVPGTMAVQFFLPIFQLPASKRMSSEEIVKRFLVSLEKRDYKTANNLISQKDIDGKGFQVFVKQWEAIRVEQRLAKQWSLAKNTDAPALGEWLTTSEYISHNPTRRLTFVIATRPKVGTVIVRIKLDSFSIGAISALESRAD